MNRSIFLPYHASIKEMTDDTLTVWLYQQKVVIKKYDVPNYQWEEIKKIVDRNKDVERFLPKPPKSRFVKEPCWLETLTFGLYKTKKYNNETIESYE